MIKVTGIEIRNFRSYKDRENIVTGIKDLNIVVGKNNVGKTNILRAIYLFFNPENYNPVTDRNMIKQITGGATKEPKITIIFEDDEIIKGNLVQYKISCDLNGGSGYKLVENSDKGVEQKLKDNTSIRKYLQKKFKCIYLSTTDENIEKQTESIIDDLILRYFKKQSKEVKLVIKKFENQYIELTNTFRNNIKGIEDNLSNQFDALKEIGIKPVLEIENKSDVTQFLMDNIKMKLDDSYVQDINSKGAGVQRASLILLSLYLLSEIFVSENKIILLDEPEAFLYPLLVKKVKMTLEETIECHKNFQVFMTTHSRDFLKEINNIRYGFYDVKQVLEETSYQRSKNDTDINKYSVVRGIDKKIKSEVLKNYGLLDEIDDYESIIVCEGPTDKNYLLKILQNEDFVPQIRYGKYVDGVGESSVLNLKYNYVGKGATAILPILIFLDNISEISRKVFVLLDGDDEGKKVYNQIKDNEYANLEIHKFILPDGKEIEDMVFTKDEFVRRVIGIVPEIKNERIAFEKIMQKVSSEESMVEQLEKYIEINKFSTVPIDKIKHYLSINLDDCEIVDNWIINELRSVFYDE